MKLIVLAFVFNFILNCWPKTNINNIPTENHNISVPLVGDTQIVDVLADGITTKALLDSGSQVSTVAECFFNKYLQSSDLISVDEILDLRQVSGQPLQYIGIIAIDLEFLEFKNYKVFSTPFLVLKDTQFNSDVPFLIGTNVINTCFLSVEQNSGPNFIQKLKISSPWKFAFQNVIARNKYSFDRAGHVRSTRSIIIPPSSEITINGITRVSTVGETLIAVDANNNHNLPAGLVLLPSVQTLDFSCGNHHRVPVKIQNLTCHQITIPAKTVICSLQEASIVDPSECIPSPEESFLTQIKFGKELSSSELDQVKELLIKWKHIFSTGDTDLGRTNKVKHHISLTNSEPFKERYRRIPPQLYHEVKEHLRDMLRAKVFKESCSPFASPIVLVKKKDGSLRFCIDF